MMKERPEAVEHLARLAAIDLQPTEMAVLVAEITRILEYVSAITAVTGDTPPDPRSWQHGALAPPRADEVRPAHPPLEMDAMAPETASGYVLVPRLDVPDDR